MNLHEMRRTDLLKLAEKEKVEVSPSDPATAIVDAINAARGERAFQKRVAKAAKELK